MDFGFTLPPILNMGSSFSTSLPAFIFIVFLDHSHSERSGMESQSGFKFHFQGKTSKGTFEVIDGDDDVI